MRLMPKGLQTSPEHLRVSAPPLTLLRPLAFTQVGSPGSSSTSP